MADPQQTDAAPIGRIPDDPAIPTLNPADSPYKPVELPQEQSAAPAPPPEQQPPQNLGAVSHAGAAAYMIDQVLRGASHGAAVGMAYSADQYNKKLTALQGLYNDQAQQMYQIAKEGRAGTFTGPAGPDGKPTFAPTQEFKQAQQRMLASWQAMMQVVGQRIPQQKKGKGKSAQGGQDDQTALLQQALDHKGDPNAALAATYQLGLKVGPPVVHQIAGFLTPEYVTQQRTAAKTQNSQATAAASTADTSATVADINNKLAHAVQSGAPQEEIDTLIKQRDELSPSAKFPIAGVQRSGQVDGKWYEWRVDENGKEIPDTRRPLSTAGLGAKAPKLGWTKVDGKWGSQNYDPETNQPIPGTFDSSKLPPANVLSLFPQEHTFHNFYVDADGNRKEFSATNTSQRDLPGGIGESGGTPPATTPNTGKPATSSPTAKTPATPGGGSVRAIDYVGSPEYKQLIKQATDAQKDFNSASTNLSTMLKTAAEAKRGDGAAQVGIISAYLKTVVGGQGTGVRITKPEWDAAVKTRPFLEGIKASFSPDGYLTGAVISPQQVDQMVNEVHQKTKSLFENVDAAKKQAQDQRTTDMSAGGLGGNSTPAAPQSNSIDDEILNLVKH